MQTMFGSCGHDLRGGARATRFQNMVKRMISMWSPKSSRRVSWEWHTISYRSPSHVPLQPWLGACRLAELPRSGRARGRPEMKIWDPSRIEFEKGKWIFLTTKCSQKPTEKWLIWITRPFGRFLSIGGLKSQITIKRRNGEVSQSGAGGIILTTKCSQD